MNSRCTGDSPAAILVFVDRWLSEEDFRDSANLIVPPYLYLSNNRAVRTCVILLERQDATSPTVPMLHFPSSLCGGGYALVTGVQGRQHVGTVGCLVTDGDQVYALTNKHITGEDPQRIISTFVAGQTTRIGVSTGKSLGKLNVEEAYGWAGTHAFTSLDAGLVLVDDLHCWTTQVFGIGQLGLPKDINPDTLSLGLIGALVKAFGGASGPMEGEIVGLFYRYRSVGGFDYIADVMIGSRCDAPLPTHPGDSGAVWVLDGPESSEEDDPTGQFTNRPLALEWGAHVVAGNQGRQCYPFVLGSFISNICRELDVDVVRDWNLGHELYWGEMGHYTIGFKACGVLSGNVGKLMSANATNVGFDDGSLSDPDKYKQGRAGYHLVPLADVADDVWRMGHNSRPADENNHFADMDHPGEAQFSGKTLLTMYEDDPNTVDPATWLEFYEALGSDINPGALPFRVWQFFDQMVADLKQGKVLEFVCGAGCMAHYVGDACQPLHVSMYHHGKPPLHKGTYQYNVHSAYETGMLDAHASHVVTGLNAKLNGVQVDASDEIKTGKDAAIAIVKLMQKTVTNLPPLDIVNFYNDITPHNQAADQLWQQFGDKTLDTLAAGVETLAQIWASAWKQGGGAAISDSQLVAFDLQDLFDLYTNDAFAPSVSLGKLVTILTP